MLWCFVGVTMSARRSRSWMASLCWQSLWQQFWQPTTSVALVYIVWAEVVANATTRKDPSILLCSAGRCLWCSHSGKDPTKPGGDGVNLSPRCSWFLEVLVLQCEEDEWKFWEMLGVGFRELHGQHFCSLTFSRQDLHCALLSACIWSVQHHVGEVLIFLCVLWEMPRRADVNLSLLVSGWPGKDTFHIAKIQSLRWETIFAFHSSELEVSKHKINPLSSFMLPLEQKKGIFNYTLSP